MGGSAAADPESLIREDGQGIVTLAARDLAHDPRVIASALTAYRAQTGRSERELATWLGLTLAGLHRLALCTKPDTTELGHRRTLIGIARYAGCDADSLGSVLCAAARDEADEPTRSA